MCTECAGTVILRTADGAEREVKVDNCDINQYYTPIMHRPVATVWTKHPEDLPIATSYSRREYRWEGRRKGPVRILEEVVVGVKNVVVADPVQALDEIFHTQLGGHA